MEENYESRIVSGYSQENESIVETRLRPRTLEEYIGKYDVSEDELSLIRTELEKSVYDDYDRLVQLCDSIAGAEGVLDIEERMLDVKRRYGFYPQKKWDAHIGLRRYFEEKMGRDVYEVCEKETYDPKKC